MVSLEYFIIGESMDLFVDEGLLEGIKKLDMAPYFEMVRVRFRIKESRQKNKRGRPEVKAQTLLLPRKEGRKAVEKTNSPDSNNSLFIHNDQRSKEKIALARGVSPL